MQRCLKVLREAADEVFNNSIVTEKLGESTILEEADADLINSSDATKVSNRFRRARQLN